MTSTFTAGVGGADFPGRFRLCGGGNGGPVGGRFASRPAAGDLWDSAGPLTGRPPGAAGSEPIAGDPDLGEARPRFVHTDWAERDSGEYESPSWRRSHGQRAPRQHAHLPPAGIACGSAVRCELMRRGL